MTAVAWYALSALVLAWIWLSALRNARKMHAFDRSVGVFVVYAWHVSVALFWTGIVVMIAFGIVPIRPSEM